MSVLINQFIPPPPNFFLYIAFTGINFRSMLHHVCDVDYEENISGPIRTRKRRSANWLINYMYGEVVYYVTIVIILQRWI